MQQTLPRWLLLAQQELGVAEVPGAEHNPKIIDYFKKAGWGSIVDDETAWCAAFASTMLRSSGHSSPQTVRARDFLKWGVALKSPKVGCIVVFSRGNNPAQGHVAFFMRYSDDRRRVLVLGGNQSNAVTYAWYNVGTILGFRWPDTAQEEPPPPPPPAPVAVADELPKRPINPIPVYNYPDSPYDVEERLREKGSRIVTGADRSELQAKGVAATGIMAIVYAVINAITDAYYAIAPLVPIVGMTVVGVIAVALAVYTIREQRRIRAARVEDDINGVHTGRREFELLD